MRFKERYANDETFRLKKSEDGKKDYQLNKERHALRMRRRTLRQYNLSIEGYESLLQKQNGTCAVCNRKYVTSKSFDVDHDHKTGEVRGLLCNRCNTSLGLLQDDPALIRRLLTYLEAR